MWREREYGEINRTHRGRTGYFRANRGLPSECLDEIEPDISDFGKTVFLTKKEAEVELKKI